MHYVILKKYIHRHNEKKQSRRLVLPWIINTVVDIEMFLSKVFTQFDSCQNESSFNK